MSHRLQSKQYTYFKISLTIFSVLVLSLIALKVTIFFINKQVELQSNILTEQNKQLDTSKDQLNYIKLSSVKFLENNQKTIPWSEHIPKVIKMLEDIKSIDPSSTESIVLSDFKINLDEVSLKGKVSKLWLLYYNLPSKRIQALLDKFTKLDFLRDISIRTYEKVADNGFEFVLNAKVVNDDSSK